MTSTLFPFQTEALEKLRSFCKKAKRDYEEDQETTIITLAAPTGAGKTIIMSGLMEKILCGDENHVGQKNAVFVWLSDDPELNEQSMHKVEHETMYSLPINSLEIIKEESFDKEVLEDGKIYFLNIQKLSKSSNLTKNKDEREHTIWETLQNTVEQKGNRLYFIIDEAHRGTQKSDAKTANSIMQKFIFGSPDDKLDKMPIVIGMSATIDRFSELIKDSSSTKRSHAIKAEDVRDSGLLKDEINISYPGDNQLQRGMAILKYATREWKEKCQHWDVYCQKEKEPTVYPVLVIQVENGHGDKISETDLNECLKTVEEELGRSLYNGEVAHSFGEPKSELTINGLKVPYVEPSRIHESTKVRIVFFKESLSTGWDCPRAETMMSFRAANDYTYIAQLVGRMVRTPLHRRIEGDESLNNVHLFLPNYNSDNVQRVIDALSSNDGEGIPTKIKKSAVGTSEEQELYVAEDKIEVFEWLNNLQLTTYVISKYRVSNYLTSLFNLAYLAANTQGVDPEAAVRVSEHIAKMIRGYVERLQSEDIYNNKVEEVRQFMLTESKMEFLKDTKLKNTSRLVLELTDYDIEREFARADAKLKNAGKRYIREYFEMAETTGLMIDVILFVQSEECMAEFDKYAKETFYQYKRDYRKILSNYNESVKGKYDKITREGEEVSDHSWRLPGTIYLPKGEQTDSDHLFVDKEGGFSYSLNSWEQQIIDDAKKDSDFVCWLRNQDRKVWSLCIPYQMDGKTHPFYPDFVIVRRDGNSGYLLDLVEPHWKDEDNIPKAKAMAKYVEDENGNVERFEMTRVYDGKMLRLDFANPSISHRLSDATKYNDDFLDNLFKEFGKD